MGQLSSESVKHNLFMAGSASQTPLTGSGVILHLFSNRPEKSYRERIANKIITNNKKITTLPRSGRLSIRVVTSTFIPLTLFILLKGLKILRVLIALKFMPLKYCKILLF